MPPYGLMASHFASSRFKKGLGVSRATAYRLITDGTLPVYRFGGRRGQRAMVRVSESDLRRWLEEHKKLPPTAA